MDCVSGCIYKYFYHFVENSARFVLKIELLLTMLSNFEREAALKNSVFYGYVFDPYKVF